MKSLESRLITDIFDPFGVKLRFAKRLVLSLILWFDRVEVRLGLGIVFELGLGSVIFNAHLPNAFIYLKMGLTCQIISCFNIQRCGIMALSVGDKTN